MPLSDIIREERQKKKLSQSELGKLLNVTQQAVGKWEKGIAEPDSDTLKTLADYFDVTVDYLVGRTESSEPQKSPEGLIVPPELNGVPMAFYDGIEGLSQESLDSIANFIKFVREQEKNKK